MDQNKYVELVKFHCENYPFIGLTDTTPARNVIPHEQINKQLDQLFASGNVNADRRDLFLAKLLQYFKEELFTWVDKLKCSACYNQECVNTVLVPPTREERRWNASTVEASTCPTCKQQYRFPRYNHPVKLMETRRGRCGEWAIGFAYVCKAFGYETRLVYDCKDHVWVEVYSEAQKRWLHTDPCENALDQPLLYSCGWKKNLFLVFATGDSEVRDVTWRYVSEWKKALAMRKQLFSEIDLFKKLEEINMYYRLRGCTIDIIKKNEERWISEITEFIRLPHQDRIEAKDNERQGRISGDIIWRLSRCEVEDTDSNPNAIIDVDEMVQPNSSSYILQYHCHRNVYEIQVNGKELPKEIQKHSWSSMVYQSENVFHNVEKDWNMCYLARKKISKAHEVGRISWKVVMSRQTASRVLNINIFMRGATFENGKIVFSLRSRDYSKILVLNEDNLLSIKDVLKVTDEEKFEFIIEAELKDGQGDIAWQHAQLFRQSLQDQTKQGMFYIKIQFNNDSLQQKNIEQ